MSRSFFDKTGFAFTAPSFCVLFCVFEDGDFDKFLLPLVKGFPLEAPDLLVDFPFGLAVFLLSKGASS
jgi:hypothetical protein